MSVLGKIREYGEEQLDDLVLFIAIAGSLGHVPHDQDACRSLRHRAAIYVRKHGTPTEAAVRKVLGG